MNPVQLTYLGSLRRLCLLGVALLFTGCVTHHYPSPTVTFSAGAPALGPTTVVVQDTPGAYSAWAGSYAGSGWFSGYGQGRYVYRWPYFDLFYPAYGWSPGWRAPYRPWHDAWAWWAPYRYGPGWPPYGYPYPYGPTHESVPGSAPAFAPRDPTLSPALTPWARRELIDNQAPRLPEERGYSAAYRSLSAPPPSSLAPAPSLRGTQPSPTSSWPSLYRNPGYPATSVRSAGHDKFYRTTTQPVLRPAFPQDAGSAMPALRNPAAAPGRSSTPSLRPSTGATPSLRVNTLPQER